MLYRTSFTSRYNDGIRNQIDALVDVAHNATIGKNCVLAAGTVIGGSVSIGNMCWFGLNSTVKHKTKIGNQVIVGAGGSVINDVLNREIVVGVPAGSIKYKITTTQLFLMAGQRKTIENNSTKNGSREWLSKHDSLKFNLL